jgi:hypothetical protein
MMPEWIGWKTLPPVGNDWNMVMPGGPGVYEVRRVANGALVAFGSSGDVARELLALRPGRVSRLRAMLPGARAANDDLEFRVCPAGSLDEARKMAAHLRDRRDVYWRTHKVRVWA